MVSRSCFVPACLLLAATLLLPAALAPPAEAGKYAVIVAGYGGQAPHVNTMSWMYKTLRNKYGYAKSDIFVLWANGQYLDLDGVAGSETWGPATRAKMFAVFDTLDFSRDVGPDDIVFVYFDDHGAQAPTTKESQLCLYWDYEKFEASEADSVFMNIADGDLVDDNWPKLLTLFDQCYSGGFVDAQFLMKRAASSAAGAAQASHFITGARPNAQWPSINYSAFTYHWLCAMSGADPEGNAVNADADGDGNVTFREAFTYAKNNDEYAKSGAETPQYWDWKGFGRAMLLDGTRLPMVVAVFRRGWPSHAGCGGAATWGDGGTGSDCGSGIVFGAGGGAPAGAASAGATSGTRQLYARVRNTGTLPLTSGLVRFYYGPPSTIASSSDATLTYVGSVSCSGLMPGDTALVGPVIMTDPGPNPFGQPYWKVFAVLESPQLPPESGWVEDDDLDAVENYHRGTSVTGEPVELMYRVSNPLPTAQRVVLRLARNSLPTGWQVQSVPTLGDTLTVGPLANLTAMLRIIPDGSHGPTGVVTVEERLHNWFAGCWEHCQGMEDSAFVSEGGFLRTTGGISFEVTAPFTSDVPDESPELRVSLAYPNPSAGGATLSYSMPFRSVVRVAVHDVAGRSLLQRDLGEQGPGTCAFTWDGRDARGSLAPAGVYLLRLQINGRTEDRRIVLAR